MSEADIAACILRKKEHLTKELFQQEDKSVGVVEWKIWKRYATASGTLYILIL